jgi:hypothetical protein
MTTPAPPADPRPVDLLVALLAARVALAFDEVVRDGLVEDLPEWARAALVDAVAAAVGVGLAVARGLAVREVDEAVAEATGEPPVPLPEPPFDGDDLDRLRDAVDVLLDRAAEQVTPAALPAPLPERSAEQRAALDALDEQHRQRRAAERKRLDDDLVRLRRQAEREQSREAAEGARALAAAERAVEADERRRVREDDRAARRDARELERIRRADERQAEADRRRDDRDAARIAAQDAARAERNAAALAEQRQQREERRQSQRARLERFARAEALAAADEAAQRAAQRAPAVLGWVRRLNDGACPTCVGWWNEPPFGRVRPLSIKMKRHPSCSCTRLLVTSRKELDARGYTDKPERVSERWRRARDRERAEARAEAGSESG